VAVRGWYVATRPPRELGLLIVHEKKLRHRTTAFSNAARFPRRGDRFRRAMLMPGRSH
jgi:hypothetical protein